jgi:hypothetical protein
MGIKENDSPIGGQSYALSVYSLVPRHLSTPLLQASAAVVGDSSQPICFYGLLCWKIVEEPPWILTADKASLQEIRYIRLTASFADRLSLDQPPGNRKHSHPVQLFQ